MQVLYRSFLSSLTLGHLPRQPRAKLQTSRVVAMAEKKEAGHSVPSTSVVAEDAVDPEILAFQEHQASAPRLSLAEEARTLIANGR
jgi:hypothetical protein